MAVRTKDVPHRQIFSASLQDVLRWKADAARQGLTFSKWVRVCLNAGGQRLNGEKAPAVGVSLNLPRQPSLPARQVREPRDPADEARRLASSAGRCTAQVGYGLRCRVCGKVHR